MIIEHFLKNIFLYSMYWLIKICSNVVIVEHFVIFTGSIFKVNFTIVSRPFVGENIFFISFSVSSSLHR